MKALFTFVLLAVAAGVSNGQDTFSIVAVDPASGLVGSAGASCINGAIVISDVHPGLGVIHTQSYWHPTNQNYARTLMDQHYSPQQIIDSLVAHDVYGNPYVRQYGIVDLVDGGRRAAYTGVDCFDYKNHILGPTYAIQGNILLGQQILDSMETRFVNTNGTFADKLMAALQGAKVPGADTRCLSSGRSSISAFIRMARPEDTTGTLYLDLNVDNAPGSLDPIDSLQQLYDTWRLANGVSGGAVVPPTAFALVQNFPNPFNPSTTISYQVPTQSHVALMVFDVLGHNVATLVNDVKEPATYRVQFDGSGLASGVYFYRMHAGTYIETKKLLLLR